MVVVGVNFVGVYLVVGVVDVGGDGDGVDVFV